MRPKSIYDPSKMISLHFVEPESLPKGTLYWPVTMVLGSGTCCVRLSLN